ncbi:coiled-coil domain-containing protein 97 isoform X2 [Cololabis saira]|uniref:coiled-coil domain-containing protein 97 isoform X2 n=1 Tax=Cololabis saira TaxID=129043 RepID=UPI002AD26992|nr:coiled-coil domain-containing protein 97 isoform X2 [Cololabis saira]
MWGEIEDPPVKTLPTWRGRDSKRNPPEDPEDPEEPARQRCDRPQPGRTAPRPELQDSPPESSGEHAVIWAVAASGSPVKSQQVGDEELTLEERRHELLQQFRSKPLVFLERYHACLKPEHLPAFAHVSSDPRAQHYSTVVQTRAASRTNRTRVRNQRYAALRALQKEGQYFSEEQMRKREPLLYEQYIGQYLTDEEILVRSQEAFMEDAQTNQGTSGGGATGGLAQLLLNSYEERLIQDRLQEEQEREDDAQEEEEDEDDVSLWRCSSCRYQSPAEGLAAHTRGEGSAPGGVHQSDAPALP